VDRPGLLPGEVEALEQPQHAVLGIAHAKAALDHIAEVTGAPGDTAVALEPGALEDDCLEGGLLALVPGAGAAGAGPIPQALDTLSVVPVHPVTQGLPVHAGGPRRLVPAHPVQGVGERQQARADPPVPLAARQRTQLRRCPPRRDRHGDHGPAPGLLAPTD
jgi:hypothetical protein